jgi:nucleotide-binding universal stress UspA family protein
MDQNTRPEPSRARDLLPDGDALIAVHIVQDPPAAFRDSPPPSDLLGRIQRLVLDVSDEGLDVALKVPNHVGAQPARAIADIAREVGADLIIVGTRGYSPIHGAVVGSVAQALLHLAPCPVLAVPPVDRPAGRRRQLRCLNPRSESENPCLSSFSLTSRYSPPPRKSDRNCVGLVRRRPRRRLSSSSS